MRQKGYLRDQTVKFQATITDFDGKTLVDPDSHELTFFDPTGVPKVMTAYPTKVSTGVYCYYFVILADATVGKWRLDWKGMKGILPCKGRMEFEVTA